MLALAGKDGRAWIRASKKALSIILTGILLQNFSFAV